MAAAEEAASGAVVSDDAASDASVVETGLAGAAEQLHSSTIDTAQPGASFEPWSGLLQFGAVLASALSEPSDSALAAHPWVERDAVTGERSLRLPLPSPEAARRLAEVLSTISDALLRNGSAKRSR